MTEKADYVNIEYAPQRVIDELEAKKEREEDEEFEKEVGKIYSALWELWYPKQGKKCQFNDTQRDKLKRMIDKIDEELGR